MEQQDYINREELLDQLAQLKKENDTLLTKSGLRNWLKGIAATAIIALIGGGAKVWHSYDALYKRFERVELWAMPRMEKEDEIVRILKEEEARIEYNNLHRKQQDERKKDYYQPEP